MTVEATVALEQRNLLDAEAYGSGASIQALVAFAQRNALDVDVNGGAQTVECDMVSSSELDVEAVSIAPVTTGCDLMNENRLRVLARSASALLPPTDSNGRVIRIPDPSSLWSLTVALGGVIVNNARLSDFVIDLDRHGGYESSSLTLQTPREKSWPRRMKCRVRYLGVTIFYGRLFGQRRNRGGELSWSLDFTSNLNDLRDHQSYRRDFVDSDLENWGLDQPSGSARGDGGFG